MPETIFLRVGTLDKISLSAFIEALNNFLRALKDLDATISRDPRGSLIWEIVTLQKNSPPLVGVAPEQKPYFKRKGFQDFSGVVESQLIENTRMLAFSGERNQFLSDSALKRLENLAKKTPALGPMGIFQSNNGPDSPKNETLITPQTLTNVRRLTGAKYHAFGSIKGNLDAISVHRDYEFRVWDETTHKAVTCKFTPEDLDRVKALLKQRVVVLGNLTSNSAGSPISISVEEIIPSPKNQLPTIEEMSGLVKDFTGGKSLKEYMEELSDE